MKRLIKSNKLSISSGVSVGKDGRFQFNWNMDNADDIILLESPDGGQFDNDGIHHMYGYEIVSGANDKVLKRFRDALKSNIYDSKIFDGNVEDFVERGVLNIEKYKSFDYFSVLVDIKSTSEPTLVGEIGSYLRHYMNSVEWSFTLIKKMYEDVTFDDVKARKILRDVYKYSTGKIEHEIEFTINKFNDLKKSGDFFQIKRFLPIEIRGAFIDYLKFENDEQRDVYKSLQGVNVLVFDDFYTSGSTLKEVFRILNSVNPSNTLTAFILIKQ